MDEAVRGKHFLVLAMRTADFDPAVIGPHRDFLDRLRGQGRLQLAGGFGDGSGGAYVLRACDLEEARALAGSDPLHVSGASRLTVFEWNV
ncbi:YciI family protein [Marilutibacter chinensis]|uniref:YciI family protein n=1 Tax=Marilutibacter chinensis TaxID=2912247 RepID=A0ABS9HXF3_9GAMM|nr:YciI family protein [Lysobacter chinensis]MCF7222812.1 YciI family protein [Lysobacter chinensis]